MNAQPEAHKQRGLEVDLRRSNLFPDGKAEISVFSCGVISEPSVYLTTPRQ